MSDYSAAMTTARMQLVLLRLQGLTLAALVEKGVLPADGAAALVRDAAKFLHSETNSPAMEEMLSGALEDVAREVGEHRHE